MDKKEENVLKRLSVSVNNQASHFTDSNISQFNSTESENTAGTITAVSHQWASLYLTSTFQTSLCVADDFCNEQNTFSSYTKLLMFPKQHQVSYNVRKEKTHHVTPALTDSRRHRPSSPGPTSSVYGRFFSSHQLFYNRGKSLWSFLEVSPKRKSQVRIHSWKYFRWSPSK